MWGVSDPRNLLIHHSCYLSRFRRSWSNSFSVGRGSQKFWGMLGPPPWEGDVADPLRNMLLPHTYYRTKFPRSRSNHLSVSRGSPPFFWGGGEVLGLRPLGWGRGWPPEKYGFPYMCYRDKFVHSRSNPTNVILEITRKFWPLASRLSRSLEVIGTAVDRSAACDFLLVFHSNHGHILYCFRGTQRFLSKIANFSNPCVFNAPAEGVPLGI